MKHLLLLTFLFTNINPSCRNKDLSAVVPLLQKTRYQGCPLEESTKSAGLARNVRAQCKQDSESFHYRISWEAPEQTTVPVTKYRVYITYESFERACFQVSSKERVFIFNRAKGLVFGCVFYFSITPQPISLADDVSQTFLTHAPSCPVGVQLLPLPNIFVTPASTFFFVASFKLEPIPKANISWYFSPDKVHCTNPKIVVNGKRSVSLSKDNMMLKVGKVEKQHIGCYVVVATNEINGKHQQYGYLNLNMTYRLPSESEPYFRPAFRNSLFILLALLVLLIAVGIILQLGKNRPSATESIQLELKRDRVYISHCMDHDTDKPNLLKLVCAIESLGVDVIIDVCSVVDINDAGGILRWISLKLYNAEKIIIAASPHYLKQMNLYREKNALCDQKTHFELNLINQMINSKLKDTKDILILVCNGNEDEILLILPWKTCKVVSFPESFNFKTDSNFMSSIKEFLGGTNCYIHS